MRAILLLALACDPQPETAPSGWEDCADLDCRTAWAIASWDSDKAAVIAAVADMGDEVEQVALVTELSGARLGQTRELCAALQRGPARIKCNQLNSRLHLVQDQPLLPAGLEREAPGPVSWRLDINDLPPSPLQGLTLDQDPCAGTEDERECRVRNAKVEAGTGNVRRAAAFCQAVVDPTWQAECAFQAAEKRIVQNHGQVQPVVDAVDLCLMAGRFADNCFGHIPLRVAESMPPVSQAPTETWTTLQAQAEALRQAITDRGAPALAEAVDGLLWAETMGYTYTTSPKLVGDPLDHLPPRAHPHVRSAAAVAMARTPAPQAAPSLAGLAAELQAALARRGSPGERKGSFQGPWRPRADLWPKDEPGDGAIPAVVYLGVSRRAWAMDDPAADLRIAILEARARLAGEPSALLEEGLQDPHPLVQWTAKRLIRMLKELPRGPVQPGSPGSAPNSDRLEYGEGIIRGKAPPGGPSAEGGRPPPPGAPGGPPPGTRAPGPPPQGGPSGGR